MTTHRTGPDETSPSPGAAEPEHRQRVVIVVSSKHGGTLEIAGAIAQELVSCGLIAVVAEPNDATELESFDAVVLGSGVYLGRWMKSARRFIEDRASELAGRKVWLFSSGPLGGDDDESGLDADHVSWLLRRSGAIAHHEFDGRLESSDLGPVESLVAHALHAPEGDFRNWDEVHAWARDVAAALVPA